MIKVLTPKVTLIPFKNLKPGAMFIKQGELACCIKLEHEGKTEMWPILMICESLCVIESYIADQERGVIPVQIASLTVRELSVSEEKKKGDPQ